MRLFYNIIMIVTLSVTSFFLGRLFTVKNIGIEHFFNAAAIVFIVTIIIIQREIEIKAYKMQIPVRRRRLGNQIEVINNSKSTLCESIMCPVYIKAFDGKEIMVDCLIDTGFTGALSLDESIVKTLNIRYVGTSENISACSKFIAHNYCGDIRIGQSSFNGIRIESSKFPDALPKGVVGMRIISHAKLNIEKRGTEYQYSFEI